MLSHEEDFLNAFPGEWKPYHYRPGRGRPEPALLLQAVQPVPYPVAHLCSGGVARLQVVRELMSTAAESANPKFTPSASI